MKTITIEVADEYMWIAQSRSGLLFLFVDKPVASVNSWKLPERIHTRVMLVSEGSPNPNWKDTLEAI